MPQYFLWLKFVIAKIFTLVIEHIFVEFGIPFFRGVAVAVKLNGCIFFIYVLCKWRIIDLISIFGISHHPDLEKSTAFVKKPKLFPTLFTPSVPITPTQGFSESASWLNLLISDFAFKMADGEFVHGLRESIILKLNKKIDAIESEYKNLVGKIIISDLSIKSMPIITAVHSTTASGVDNDVGIVFDFEYNGGITFQIFSKNTLIGAFKFDARLDYFKSKLAVHFKNKCEKSWSISLSEAPKISIVLGLGKHNLYRVAKIIQKFLFDRIQSTLVYPNIYKYIIRDNIIGFSNAMFKVDDCKPFHYAIKVVRGRNLPIKKDWKPPFVTVSYADKEHRCSTQKTVVSPLFGATFAFVPQEKHAFLHLSVAQKSYTSRSVFSVASFDFSVALFTKNFKRVRFDLEGRVLEASDWLKDTYISVDLIYYEKNDPATSGDIAKFLYGPDALQKIKELPSLKRKTSKFMSILKATRNTKANSISFSSSDLIKYLDGQSSAVYSDLQFVQNNLREKSNGLSRFWNQQIEILKGSKNGETSLAALSVISKNIHVLSQDIADFLTSFRKVQSIELDADYSGLNNLCDLQDKIGSSITQLYRLLNLKSSKDFKFIPQILDYLKEISILLGQIGASIYKKDFSDAESIDDDSNSIMMISNFDDADFNYRPLSEDASARSMLADAVDPLAAPPFETGHASNSQLLIEIENASDHGNDASTKNINLSNSSHINVSSSNDENSSVDGSPVAAAEKLARPQTSSPVSSTNSLRLEDQAAFCRLFRIRSKFFFVDSAVVFEQNTTKILDSHLEGIFYIVDPESVAKIYSENVFSSFKAERKVVGFVSAHRIYFSKSDKINFSTIINISAMEIESIIVTNIKNSHFNLLKIKLLNPKQSSFYLAGEKSIVLSFFNGISSWLFYYDSIAKEEKDDDISQTSFSLPFEDIVQVKSTRSSLIVDFIGSCAETPIHSPNVSSLIMKDFFGPSIKASTLQAFSSKIAQKSFVDLTSLEDEMLDLSFYRQSRSILPSGYYFEKFKIVGQEEPISKASCAITGEHGEVSVTLWGIFFKSLKISYVIPFSQIQSFKLMNNVLAKGIKITLNNNETVRVVACFICFLFLYLDRH